MARFTSENTAVADDIIARYPRPRSAMIPLLHLAQEQDGHLTDEAMEHIAELTGVTPAEVLGTASFYEMFKRHECGRYVVNVCTSISCHLMGGDELLHHAEEKLGIKAGATTADGMFTLEGYECQAACTEAPALQVNYRYFHKVTPADFDQLVDDLRAGRHDADIPPHGTLHRIRQRIPADRRPRYAREQVFNSLREPSGPRHARVEGIGLGAVGQGAEQEQIPGVLEGALAGDVDRRVLPVVVEAFVPSDVAEGGLRHDDIREAAGDVDEGVVHPLCAARVHVASVSVYR